MSSDPAGRRIVVRRVFAVVLGLLAALALGEVLLRVLRPRYAARTADYRILPVSEHPPSWVYRPGSKVVFEWDGDPIGVLPEGERMETAINRLGLRGPEPSPAARRVVMLGDSFTFGEGVPDEETFVARLDAALRGEGLQVLNAGVAGHGTVEEAARLEGLLESCGPAAVVLVHVPNDAIPWQESAERGQDLLEAGSDGGLSLVSFARGLAARGDVEGWYLSYYSGSRREAWDRAREALVWMSETCAARGVRFGVVTFPLMHRLGEYPLAEISAHVRAFSEDNGVPYLDLLPAFTDGADERDLWVHPADRHPNAHAHAIASDALLPFVAGLAR